MDQIGAWASGTELSSWTTQKGAGHAINAVPAPWNNKGGAFFFNVDNRDTDVLSPYWIDRRNPGAYLSGPERLLQEGQAAFICWRVMFPKNFPRVTERGWIRFAGLEGPTHVAGKDVWSIEGPQPLVFGVNLIDGVEKIVMLTPRGRPWTAMLTRGVLHRIVLQVFVSSRDDEGFMRLWHQGVPQVFDGETELPGALIERNQSLSPFIGCQFKKGQYNFVPIFHGACKVGSSYGDSL